MNKGEHRRACVVEEKAVFEAGREPGTGIIIREECLYSFSI